MRKTIQTTAVMLLSALLMLLGLTLLPANAADIKLYDEGNRLSDTEFSECEARIRQASDHIGMNIGVILGTEQRADATIESTCKMTYNELFGAKTDGLIYYMDLKGYEPYDFLAASGMAQFYYTNHDPNRQEEIYDQLDDYLYPLGSENVYDAVMKFTELVEFYYDAGIPEHCCVYDEDEKLYYHIENNEMIATPSKPYRDPAMIGMFTCIGVISGLIAALATFFGVKSAYQFKSALSPTTYANRKNVIYNEQYDNFTHTSTSRVHIEHTSGGGHGGGGVSGFSSGGFSSSGHHR